MRRRVVITGIGVVSPLGLDVPSNAAALREGRSAIAPMELVDRSLLRFQNGAEVRGFDPTQHFDEKDISLLDRFAQFAVVAAREAVQYAGISFSNGLGERTAIVTGSCVGGQTTEDEGFLTLYRNNNPRANPFTIPRVMANAGASRISLEFGIVGPAWTVSTACSSSNHAIGQAFRMVRDGDAELRSRAAAKPCSVSAS